MSSFTLELPDTLHRQLEALARNEGVSLAQYVIYAPTRQASFAYQMQAVWPEVQREEREALARLLSRVPAATDEEMAHFLVTREPVEPEPGLTPEIVARLRARMQSK